MAVPLGVMMKRALMLLVAFLFCYMGPFVGAASLAASMSSKALSSLTSKLPGQYHLKCPDHVIEALEGGRVTLQCFLHPSLDLTGLTLDVKRSDLPVNGEVVLAYRNGDDYLDPQMPMYKSRVILVHDDLSRGMLTVQIYPVKLSDSGQYKFFVSKLRNSSHVNLTVAVSNVQQNKSKSFDSSSIRPPAEDVNVPEDHVDPEKGERPVWKIIVPVVVIAAAVPLVVVVIMKYKQKNRGRKDGASKTDKNSYL